ncbi:hypothetical protein [Leekyejoonella antrihumi]|uniref:Uncharacterized protein n=1 Tax=Leekyejoonella antrihumi TaxID=1660198 RepID=A0A563E5S7_9MICO|nr:hypothetical protein [Leekyejoonella antrihumi]TWP37572.1 hypothetical protein FGL98_04965 [Leekyejoonella antrihumi]
MAPGVVCWRAGSGTPGAPAAVPVLLVAGGLTVVVGGGADAVLVLASAVVVLVGEDPASLEPEQPATAVTLVARASAVRCGRMDMTASLVAFREPLIIARPAARGGSKP